MIFIFNNSSNYNYNWNLPALRGKFYNIIIIITDRNQKVRYFLWEKDLVGSSPSYLNKHII